MEVCDEAKSTINTQGNAALETLPVIVQVDSISEIDFRLLQSPSFTSEYMETLHKVNPITNVKPSLSARGL